MARRRPPARRAVARAGFGALAAMILVFGVGQLVIPAVATDRLTSSLSGESQGVRVSLSAVPGVKLLFGYADTVTVQITRMVAAQTGVGALLARTAKVGTLGVRVGELDTHGLVLTDVTLKKQGAQLTATATLSRSALAAALPASLTLTPRSSGGSGLTLAANLRVLGAHFSGVALVQAKNGSIVVSPTATILSSLRLTIFADPTVAVDSLRVVENRASYSLSASGHYR